MKKISEEEWEAREKQIITTYGATDFQAEMAHTNCEYIGDNADIFVNEEWMVFTVEYLDMFEASVAANVETGLSEDQF